MLSSILSNFSARLIGAIMNFFMLLLTTHALGKEVRGEISIIQLSINIIHLISDIVGGPGLVYLVPRTKLSVLYITGWLWALFSCAGIGVILVQGGWMPATFSTEVLIASFLLSLNSINMNILLGQQRIKEYNLLLYIQNGLMFATMAASIFILKHEHAVPYLDACYVAYGITFLFGLSLVLKKKHEPQLKENRSVFMVLFANGFFTQIATLTHQLSIRQSYYHLETAMHDNKASVGIFSTAISLAEAILLFSASVAAVLMSKVSNEIGDEISRKRALRLSKFSVAITLPGVMLFVLLPPDFYSWLLGKDFSAVHSTFVALAPGIIMVSFGTVFGHYFSGSGKHYMNFFSGICALSITLTIIHPLIAANGTEGAGWSATFSYSGLAVFIFIMFMISGRKYSGEWKELLPNRNDLDFIKRFTNRKKVG
jgi:O-antigen/teichoic acid export membrane protein